MRDYKACIQNLNTFSKNANIFVLIHKMDKISDSEKEKARARQISLINFFRFSKAKKEKLLKQPLPLE